MKLDKLRVSYFQRKPRAGFNFSIEQIFDRIREELEAQINSRIVLSSRYNTGFISKLINIVQAAYKQDNSISHITGEVHFLNFLMKKNRVVLTIHDCGMVKRKKGFAAILVKWLYLRGPVNRSAIVTTVSNTTKAEVIHYTKCDPEKVLVIPNPVATQFKFSPKEFNNEQPHILQIGTGPNKNLERLTESLIGLGCKLTIVGKLSEIQKKQLQDSRILYNQVYNISNEELLQCYISCDILAFVSTFEGFGMPIVEANALGRVVITSNVSSMPEVAGNAACMVDPYDVNSIRKGFERIINEKSYREELIENGVVNSLRFNAKTIAQQYYDVYRLIQEEKYE